MSVKFQEMGLTSLKHVFIHIDAISNTGNKKYNCMNYLNILLFNIIFQSVQIELIMGMIWLS